ncbi:hypothetical protein E2562_017329 [Oryza meyeriana var. granulata]|uniref:Retroviral polymerase SH3-like domain-containing protein n=1 Tax=Oryza meyeriana var. granulata TaxID=110450 RepID=A0A6G1BX98_9ORYZ|nr:hypothetical protein E2562_017329 [Oryza meyeriana var. granulata]
MAITCSLLKAKRLPGEFWGEAVMTAVYLLNCSPAKSLTGKTLYEAWHDRKPSVHHLRTFGCLAYIKIVKLNMKKLEDRSLKTIFLRYETGSKAYWIYDPVEK